MTAVCTVIFSGACITGAIWLMIAQSRQQSNRQPPATKPECPTCGAPAEKICPCIVHAVGPLPPTPDPVFKPAGNSYVEKMDHDLMPGGCPDAAKAWPDVAPGCGMLFVQTPAEIIALVPAELQDLYTRTLLYAHGNGRVTMIPLIKSEGFSFSLS